MSEEDFAAKMARAYHQQGRYQSWDQLPVWWRKSLIERMRLAIEAMEPGAEERRPVTPETLLRSYVLGR
jgi:hypothetical protein